MDDENRGYLAKVLRDLADQVEAMPPDSVGLNLACRYRNLGLDDLGWMRREALPGYEAASIDLRWRS